VHIEDATRLQVDVQDWILLKMLCDQIAIGVLCDHRPTKCAVRYLFGSDWLPLRTLKKLPEAMDVQLSQNVKIKTIYRIIERV
jgi:hypothetical protein